MDGGESILLASSLDQARAVFRFLRARCDDPDFRYLDSGQRVAATHVPTHTRVKVASSDAKRAFGIVGARLIVGDEPGAWQERGGALMYDVLETSGGKNELTLILIGTRAPAPEDGWWRKLVDGEPEPGTYVQVHAAPVDDDGEVPGWSTWRTIRRANPLIDFNPFPAPEAGGRATQGEARRRRAAAILHLPPQRSTTARTLRRVHGRPMAAGRVAGRSCRIWAARGGR